MKKKKKYITKGNESLHELAEIFNSSPEEILINNPHICGYCLPEGEDIIINDKENNNTSLHLLKEDKNSNLKEKHTYRETHKIMPNDLPIGSGVTVNHTTTGNTYDSNPPIGSGVTVNHPVTSNTYDGGASGTVAGGNRPTMNPHTGSTATGNTYGGGTTVIGGNRIPTINHPLTGNTYDGGASGTVAGGNRPTMNPHTGSTATGNTYGGGTTVIGGNRIPTINHPLTSNTYDGGASGTVAGGNRPTMNPHTGSTATGNTYGGGTTVIGGNRIPTINHPLTGNTYDGGASGTVAGGNRPTMNPHTGSTATGNTYGGGTTVIGGNRIPTINHPLTSNTYDGGASGTVAGGNRPTMNPHTGSTATGNTYGGGTTVIGGNRIPTINHPVTGNTYDGGASGTVAGGNRPTMNPHTGSTATGNTYGGGTTVIGGNRIPTINHPITGNTYDGGASGTVAGGNRPIGTNNNNIYYNNGPISPNEPMLDLTYPFAIFCNMIRYIVEPDDTANSIAKKFGTSISEMLALNPQIDIENLKAGTILHVCDKNKLLAKTCETMLYVIKQNDTLYSIARQFNTNVESIMALNKNINPYNLQEGEKIIVCVNRKKINYIEVFRKLIIKFTLLNRMLISAVVNKDEKAIQKFRQDINQNINEMATIYDMKYGIQQTKELAVILRQFVQLSENLVKAILLGNQGNFDTINEDLYTNIDNLVNLVSKNNTSLNKEELQKLLYIYIRFLKQQMALLISRDYETDIFNLIELLDSVLDIIVTFNNK